MSAITRIAAITAGLLLAFASSGQDDELQPLNPERMKELKAQKTAYLTTKLELSTEEAQRFWPVYNEFDAKRETLRKELRDMHRAAREGQGAISESKAKELLAKGLEIREREARLEREYSDRFVQSIGAVKTLELNRAERDFHREVLKRFRERMEERRESRPGPGGRGR